MPTNDIKILISYDESRTLKQKKTTSELRGGMLLKNKTIS